MNKSKSTNKIINKPVKKKLTPEQQGQRMQRIFFSILAIMIISSWIISLVAKY